jgi:hypothetical protein
MYTNEAGKCAGMSATTQLWIYSTIAATTWVKMTTLSGNKFCYAVLGYMIR